MTSASIKSPANQPLEDISAHNLRDAYRLAERRGYFGAPVEQYAEPCYGGRVLQVLRFPVRQAAAKPQQ
ncbi:MAG: hypothetical protein JWP42_4337 [Pseudomonas sp.]|nr:hypothetical protein [Pseudomonas sp.]